MDEFLATFPCYTPVVETQPGMATTSRTTSWIIQMSADGLAFVLFFTDKSALRDYVRSEEMRSMRLSSTIVMAEVATPQKLSEILQHLTQVHGREHHALLDRNPPFPGYPVPYSEIVCLSPKADAPESPLC